MSKTGQKVQCHVFVYVFVSDILLINPAVLIACTTGLRPVTPPEEQEESAEKCLRDNNKPVMVKQAAAASVGLGPAAASGYCAEPRRLHRPMPERSITVANPDLLMKLFDVVDTATGRKINPSTLTGHIRRTRSVVCLSFSY